MFSKINNITILKNEPLANHCSFKVGGKAKFFIMAHEIDSLLDVLHICNQHSINHKIIGGGSNILFDDLGFNGAIIFYDNDFKQIKDGKLQASSGCDLSRLIQYTKQFNLGGFEFSVGVPAKLGGAIVNNLGAYNQEISTYIDYVSVLKNNQILYLAKQDCNFNYHSSKLQNDNSIILGATFNLPFQNKIITQQKCIDFFSKRNNSQPLNFPNAGSIFRRTEHVIPAKLIDDLGLKGLRIGDAQVSTKHAGFIVNLGNAKSKEILNLIKIIKNKIHEKYYIELCLEIEHLPYF